MTDLKITLAGETVTLLPERALYWPRERALFAADLHWGKDAAFRAKGIGLPEGTTADDLKRLADVITRTGADRLFLLGDLFHARTSQDSRTLAWGDAWRSAHTQLEITLIRGNHDLHAGDPPAAWNVRCADAPYSLRPFILFHHPTESAEGYALTGHLHPGAVLRGHGLQGMKLPCFWFGRTVGVLPAFGDFTGTAAIRPKSGDRVYLPVDDTVLAI